MNARSCVTHDRHAGRQGGCWVVLHAPLTQAAVLAAAAAAAESEGVLTDASHCCPLGPYVVLEPAAKKAGRPTMGAWISRILTAALAEYSTSKILLASSCILHPGVSFHLLSGCGRVAAWSLDLGCHCCPDTLVSPSGILLHVICPTYLIIRPNRHAGRICGGGWMGGALDLCAA
jgi:hypothetical protein